MTIAERLERAQQLDYLSLDDCALVLTVSKASIRRRLPKLQRIPHAILRDGRTVRIKRLDLYRVFGRSK